MAKIRFTLNNLVDIASTITATNEVATLPIENVQDMSRGKIFRSTTTTSVITITFPTTYTISTFTVGNHNLTLNDTIAYTFYDGINGTGTSLHSGNFQITSDGAKETASDIIYSDIKNATYYKENANNVLEPQTGVRSVVLFVSRASGVVDIGRIIIGDAVEATYNISYGHYLSFEEPTTQYRTDSGSLRSDMALPYKRFEFNMNTMSESDRQVLQRGFADVGKRRDFTVSVFPCDDIEEKKIDYSGIVKLTRIPKFQEFQHNWYKAKYVMEEV